MRALIPHPPTPLRKAEVSPIEPFFAQENFYVHLRKSISAQTAHQRSTFFEREEINKRERVSMGSFL